MTGQSVDSRERELVRTDLAQNYIVEAAAGTGKTTLLVERILNLITEGKANPDEIVAITFTERAAAELKIRLRDELGKALAVAKGAPRARARGNALAAAKGGARDGAEATEHLAAALWAFERMQVTTIHSFCATLLRERPVEAGIDPKFEVADQLMADLIADRTWEEWLSREMDGDDAVLKRAVLLGVKLDNMRSLAMAMVEHRDMLDHLPRPHDLEKVLTDYVAEFRRLAATLETLCKSKCKQPGDKAAIAIGEIGRIARHLDKIKEAGAGSGESPAGIEAVVLEDLGIEWQSRWGSKGKWESEDALDEARRGIDTVKDLHQRARDSIHHNALAQLAQKLLGYVEAYKRAKDMEEVLDFQDLLLCARDTLSRHAEVRRYFARRYKYILVDEFQDTDPLQAEIIFLLSEKDPGKARTWEDAVAEPGKVFLVGDPKQSIYRFRRADIEMYATAKEKLGKKHLLNIHQNFRCAPTIVDSVNTIFGDLFQPSAGGNYQPEYVPLHFGRKKHTVPDQHGVIVMHPDERITSELTNAHKRRTYEARAIAAFIKRVMAEGRPVYDKPENRIRPVMLRDIAILMETHKPLPYLEEALRLYEVDFRVIGGRHFYLRQEVQQLAAVLRAIENPYDTVALVAALRSPFFGISDEDIFLYYCGTKNLSYLKDARGTPLAEAFSTLRELHRIRNAISVEDLLRRLYEATRAPVTYLLKPGGEQRVANLLKIADTARALYERGICTLRGLVIWLRERESQEVEEAEAITVESGDDFVRILTMHKAKGLEFPMVILTDLSPRPRRRTEKLIIDRVNNDIAISVGKKDGIRTANFDDLRDFEDLRWQAEKIRLLYVSMTRARDFLVLPAYWAARTERLKSGELKDGSLMKTLAPHIPGPDSGELPKGMDFYDTSLLNLEPEQPPAFRIPVLVDAAKARTKVPKKAIEAEERWNESRERFAAIAARGRVLMTPTGEIEFTEAGSWGASGEAEAGHERFEARPGGRARGADAELAPDATRKRGTTGDIAAHDERREVGDLATDSERQRGKEFGDLVHKLLEAVDWENPGDLRTIAAGIRGTDEGDEMASAAADMVGKAIKTELIRRILRADAYYKEVPFAVQYGRAAIGGSGDEDYISGKDTGTYTSRETRRGPGRDTILEGKIDVLFREREDLSVLDFKTDRVPEKEVETRAEKYRPQVLAYARAVEAACGKRPKEVILFFLSPMKAIWMIGSER